MHRAHKGVEFRGIGWTELEYIEASPWLWNASGHASEAARNLLHTVADLYICRWRIELFFKWVNKHLRIKRFSERRKAPDMDAVCVYVLIAIVKKRLALHASLYTILQMVSVTAFENTPLDQLLNIGTHPSTMSSCTTTI